MGVPSGVICLVWDSEAIDYEQFTVKAHLALFGEEGGEP